MVLTRLLRSRSARFLTAFSLAAGAKQAFDDGRTARAGAMLVLAALAWKWAAVGLLAQGALRLLSGREDRQRAVAGSDRR